MAKQSVSKVIKSSNDAFVKFAEIFAKQISNEELISALAQKDLVKLAQVFKLVFDLLEKNEQSPEDRKLDEIIRAVAALDVKEEADE